MTTYKMVQIPPNVANLGKGAFSAPPPSGQVAAAYLEQVVNEYAKAGWEFHRVDAIGIVSQGGCLSFSQATRETVYVITFKRES